MPQAGVLKAEFYNTTINPVGRARVGDVWWDGTTLRIMVGGTPLSPTPVWRDITTTAAPTA